MKKWVVKGHVKPPEIEPGRNTGPLLARDDPQARHANAWLAWVYENMAEDHADVEVPEFGDDKPIEEASPVDWTSEFAPRSAVLPSLDLPGKDIDSTPLPKRYLPPGRLVELYDMYKDLSAVVLRAASE